MLCKRCGLEKEEIEMSPGRKWCRECYREYQRIYAREHPQKRNIEQDQLRKEFVKKYRNRPDVKEKQRLYYREWYKRNGRNRAIDYAEAIYEWRQKNPEKVLAHAIVREAIRRKQIERPTVCEKCSREITVSAHHDDYSKPLDVKWLCSSCHKTVHESEKGHRI